MVLKAVCWFQKGFPPPHQGKRNISPQVFRSYLVTKEIIIFSFPWGKGSTGTEMYAAAEEFGCEVNCQLETLLFLFRKKEAK